MLTDIEVAIPELGIPGGTLLVRGYNITVPVNITLHNTNDTIDIVTLTGTQYNYNVTLWLTDADMTISPPTIQVSFSYY